MSIKLSPEKIKRLIGKKWGRWTLLKEGKAFPVGTPNGRTTGVFICDCGSTTTRRLSTITGTKGSKSCGCVNKEKTAEGKRFGRLMVLSVAGYSSGQAIWLCKCDCGKKKQK